MDECQVAVCGLKDYLGPLFTALTALGGILLSSHLTTKHLERRQLNEARLECYAQWSVAMSERVHIYARQLDKPLPDDGFKVLHTKLLMMEPDHELRGLVNGMLDTLPKLFTPEFKEMYDRAQQEPGLVWEPFQTKMDELVERVHGSLHPKVRKVKRSSVIS